MSNSLKFHEQLASLVEVLANTAVTEICKLVDDGYAVLRLEISQGQREIDNLRKKLLVTKLQSYRRTAGRIGTLRQRRALQRRADAGEADGVRETRDCPSHLVPRFSVQGSPTRQGGSQHDAGLSFANHNGIPNTRNSDTQGRKMAEEEEVDLPFIIKVESLPPCAMPVDPPEKGGGGGGGGGAGEAGSGDPEPCNPSLGPEDWEPDVVVVVDPPDPVKVEEAAGGRSSRWSLAEHDAALGGGSCLEGGENGGRGGGGGGGGEREYMTADFNRLPFGCYSSSSSSLSFSSPAVSASLGASRSLQPHQDPRGPASAPGGLHHQHLPPLSSSSSSSSSRPHPLHHSSLLLLPPGLPRGRGGGGGGGGGSGREDVGGGAPSGVARPQFRCEVCGKLFPRPAALQRHQRVHTGEKPFSCRHCTKRFSYGHQLKNHERVHTGERPFPCTYCGKSFTQSSHMKRHLSVHTGHSMFRLNPR